MERFDGVKIGEIMFRRIAGTISPEEQEYLDRWLSASDANRAAYDRLVKGESMKVFSEDFGDLSDSKMLSRVDRRIALYRRRRLLVGMASSAAVLAVVVTIMFGPLRRGDTSVPTSAPEEKTYALLSLPDGRQTSLGYDEQGGQWQQVVADAAAGAEELVVRVEVPRGREYRLELSDGTQVWLNSETVIEYPSSFGGDTREVALCGEAFFEVAKDPGKPFVVTTSGDVKMEVLGTSFNLAAYPSDGRIAATLVTGRIGIYTETEHTELAPGQQAVISGGEISVSEVDVRLFTAWREGVFEFENMTLEDICTRLARWYDVDFNFEGGSGRERFTGGTWKYVELEDLLSRIEQLTDVSFIHDGGRIIVRYK